MINRGTQLKLQIKQLVLNLLQNETVSSPSSGLTTAAIFKKCGLGWGDYKNATNSQQQYWLVGLLRELESENLIKRDEKKLWKVNK